MTRKGAWLGGALSLLLASQLHGAPTDRPSLDVSSIPAIPRDLFDDATWQKATPFGLVAPTNGITGAAPKPDKVYPAGPEDTKVRMLWCPDALLVRFDCQDSQFTQVPGPEAAANQRDVFYFKADSVEVFLDPEGDGRLYMEFEFNPHGGLFDQLYLCTSDLRFNPDFSTDGDEANRDVFMIPAWNLDGLRSAGKMWPDGKGWSVVALLPAAPEILKRKGATQYALGMKFKINLVRFDYYNDGRPFEITNWAPVLGGCAHLSPAGMGTITLK